MNAGLITARYAKALLMLVQEDGSGDRVYSQVCSLARQMEEVPRLREHLEDNGDLAPERKQDLISAAVGGSVERDLERFAGLVMENRRMDLFLRMLLAFIAQYRKAAGIKTGRLVTARPADEFRAVLEKHIRETAEASDVQIEAAVNPDIIGGFIFEMDGMRLDASVSGRIASVRKRLVGNVNRIV